MMRPSTTPTNVLFSMALIAALIRPIPCSDSQSLYVAVAQQSPDQWWTESKPHDHEHSSSQRLLEGEEEEQQQQQKDEEEDQAIGEEEEAADEAADENNLEEAEDNPNEELATDDSLDDQMADDQQGEDDTAADVRVYDDYYLFQEDPVPPSLMPLSARKVIGYLLVSLTLCLGATGGIGGGGILIPVYMLVTGLPLRLAVPVGAATVLGGALGSTLVNCHRRHPLADRPIIDWDLVLVMEPLVLVGTIVGVMFHRLMSEKFLVVLLVLLLSTTAHTTLTKAMRMYQAETRYIRHLKAAQAEPPSGSPPRSHYTWTATSSGGATHDDHDLQIASTDNINSRMPREEKERILILNPDYVTLRSDLLEEEKFAPRTKIGALVLMFTVLIFLNVMVGGGVYESPWGIRCGSVAFWTVHVIMIFFLIASAWAAHTYVVARHEIKELVRFDFTHGDINWKEAAILYPLTFIGAGFFAGALGIGGGVITVPLMLHFGLHPAVAAASSSCMIFFTSFASSTIFAVFGLLLPDFGLVGFCVGFFAALTGQSIMRQARQAKSASGRNFERNSYTAFVIGGVILISALLMTIQYVLIIVERPEDYEGGLCEGYRFI